MPEERDELEQAWQALTERERLLQQTMARRSGEIDARARRFDEIAADLDARRQLIEDAEEELVERERRLSLGEQEIEDRRVEIERAVLFHLSGDRREHPAPIRFLHGSVVGHGWWFVRGSFTVVG